MSFVPEIAVIDDGELRDVRRMIRDLGAEFTHWTKAQVPARGREPRALLITTAAYAGLLGYRRPRGSGRNRPTWIAVADDEARSLRTAVHEWGFDSLVRRPVHPVAMRTLILRALFRGREQRERSRVVVGYDTAFRSGQQAKSATLVDVGTAGCRLIADDAVPVDSRIAVQFPEAIAGTGFAHPGIVVRCQPGADEYGSVQRTTLGVRFARLDREAKARMLRVLNDLKHGPAVLPTAPVRDPRDWCDRVPRGIYEADVPILGMGNFFLAARDLSLLGVRVAPHPALCMGASLRIGFAVQDGDPPVVVDANVIRSDGPRGTVLCFDWIDDLSQSRIVHLVEGLPPVACSDSGDENDATLRHLVHAAVSS